MATADENEAIAEVGGMQTATIQLPVETLAYLREEARKRGVSTGDMVRIAIGTQKYLTRQIDRGGRVQLKNRDGRSTSKYRLQRGLRLAQASRS